jgi:hypothetical protein
MAMGNEWGKLPDEEKSKYLTQYKKALEGYKHEIQIWEEKMIRLGHIDVVRNEALIEPKGHSTRASRRHRGGEQ